MDGEIALHAWQLKLPSGCVYCLPVLAADRLQFAPWRPGDPLVSNAYGIPEPEVEPGSLLDARQMTLVVAPLVGFDARGARLGMGGGWYDRSFAFRRERSEEHTSELQSLMRISYAVFCLKKKNTYHM